jgi:hypothetical protein
VEATCANAQTWIDGIRVVWGLWGQQSTLNIAEGGRQTSESMDESFFRE